MESVFEKLQQRLDDMSTGFPATDRKIEIKILKQLFDENEAELFLALSPNLEKPKTVANRLNADEDEIAKNMETMAKKGLLFRHRTPNTVQYSTIPFVAGIFEYQVGLMTKNIAIDIKDYFEGEFGPTIMAYKHPLMRTIPIHQELKPEYPIAPYEDVEQIFDKQEKIALLNCVCRIWGRLTENGCEKPLETCFYFGSQADYFVENGVARYIEAEEAKTIVKDNLEKTGLVMQLAPGQNPDALCMCCGDCCNMLLSLKMQSHPAKAAKSNYIIKLAHDDCTGCEECVSRCQMDAVEMVDEIATINYDRCIGCGTCIYGCPTEALNLEKKPQDQLYVPPVTSVEALIEIAEERGKL